MMRITISVGGIRTKYPSELEALSLLAKRHGPLVERISREMKADDHSVRAEILEKLRAVAAHPGRSGYPRGRPELAPPHRPPAGLSMREPADSVGKD